MARRVFFSFHFDRDIFRVNQVRNCNVVKASYATQHFLDNAGWEKVKGHGDAAIKHFIEQGLRGASVLVVLIGRETSSRKWVNYEIDRAFAERMGILGVRIHQISGILSNKDTAGPNPLDNHQFTATTGSRVPFSNYFKTYDWVADDGHSNIGKWIEAAAQQMKR